MKFLCPSCKAKYQIADEKVIGRSVKMKCRQCGYVIEIQESVVGASTASIWPQPLSKLPPPGTDGAVEKPLTDDQKRPEPAATRLRELANATHSTGLTPGVAKGSATTATRESAAAKVPAHKPLLTLGARPEPAKSKATHSPAAPRVAPAAVAPKVSPAGERTVGSAGASAHRPAPRQSPRSPAVATAAASPVASAVHTLGTNVQVGVSPGVTPAPSGSGSLEGGLQFSAGGTRKAGEALVEAFTSAVGDSPNIASDQLVGDEWYVGINDAPVGPIPLSEIRARASQGQVTVDSLVWRDGFEDWKPLRSFPELMAVVEEAISSLRASHMPLPAQMAAGNKDPQQAGAAAGAAVVSLNLGVASGALAAESESVAHIPVAAPQFAPEDFRLLRSHRDMHPKVLGWQSQGH